MIDADRVVELYRDGLSHREIAAILKCKYGTCERVLRGAGYTDADLYEREHSRREEVISEQLGCAYTDAETCPVCTIIMIDEPHRVPDGWSWTISGKTAKGICYACNMEIAEKYKIRFEKLVEIGCYICRFEYNVYSKPEIHHVRLIEGERRKHEQTIPLCAMHHRLGDEGVARHAGKYEWERRHGPESEMLRVVNLLLE